MLPAAFGAVYMPLVFDSMIRLVTVQHHRNHHVPAVLCIKIYRHFYVEHMLMFHHTSHQHSRLRRMVYPTTKPDRIDTENLAGYSY